MRAKRTASGTNPFCYLHSYTVCKAEQWTSGFGMVGHGLTLFGKVCTNMHKWYSLIINDLCIAIYRTNTWHTWLPLISAWADRWQPKSGQSFQIVQCEATRGVSRPGTAPIQEEKNNYSNISTIDLYIYIYIYLYYNININIYIELHTYIYIL